MTKTGEPVTIGAMHITESGALFDDVAEGMFVAAECDVELDGVAVGTARIGATIHTRDNGLSADDRDRLDANGYVVIQYAPAECGIEWTDGFRLDDHAPRLREYYGLGEDDDVQESVLSAVMSWIDEDHYVIAAEALMRGRLRLDRRDLSDLLRMSACVQ